MCDDFGSAITVTNFDHIAVDKSLSRVALFSRARNGASPPLPYAGWQSDQTVWSALSHDVHFTKHDVVFDQAEPQTYVHLIAAGLVCMHKTLSDGRRLVLGFALPGDFIGSSGSGFHGYSASAVDQVTTHRMTYDNFMNTLETKPHFALSVHQSLAEDLQTAHEQMMVLGRCSARERTAAFILNLSQRWNTIHGHGNLVPLPMTRADIGDYLGLTIETVSRVLNAFARESMLEILPDGVRILDRGQLEHALAV